MNLKDQLKEFILIEENWDDDGAAKIDDCSIFRAEEFLENFSIIPILSPVPDGSIDMHWKMDGGELLINSGVGEDCHFSFYGDKKDGTMIKGLLDPKQDYRWIEIWLK